MYWIVELGALPGFNFTIPIARNGRNSIAHPSVRLLSSINVDICAARVPQIAFSISDVTYLAASTIIFIYNSYRHEQLKQVTYLWNEFVPTKYTLRSAVQKRLQNIKNNFVNAVRIVSKPLKFHQVGCLFFYKRW